MARDKYCFTAALTIRTLAQVVRSAESAFG